MLHNIHANVAPVYFEGTVLFRSHSLMLGAMNDYFAQPVIIGVASC